MEDEVYADIKETDPYVRYKGITNNFENPQYDEAFKKSVEDKEGFWEEQAKELHWDRFPQQILDNSNKNAPRWYPDGMQNICYNCIDRHVDAGRGDEVALIYDSVYHSIAQNYTYRELQSLVGKLAHIFKN